MPDSYVFKREAMEVTRPNGEKRSMNVVVDRTTEESIKTITSLTETKKEEITKRGDDVKSSIPTDYTKLVDDVSRLSESINEYISEHYLMDSLCKYGFYTDVRGEYTASDIRLCSSVFIPVKSGTRVMVKNGYKYRIALYRIDAENTFVKSIPTNGLTTEASIVDADGYIRITLGRNDDAKPSTNEISNLIILRLIDTNEIIDTALDTQNDKPLFTKGFLTLNSGEISDSLTRKSTLNFIKMKKNDRLIFSGGYKYRVHIFSEAKEGNQVECIPSDGLAPVYDKTVFVAPQDCYVKYVIAKLDDSDLSDIDVTECVAIASSYTDAIIPRYKFNRNIPHGYYRQKDIQSPFDNSTKSADVYSFLDRFIDNKYCTRETIFTETGSNLNGYAYKFFPRVSDVGGLEGKSTNYPTIIIASSVHGADERVCCFSACLLIKQIVEDYHDNDFLSYLRNSVNIIFVPLVNPWGFDNNKNVNHNSVNINRNYDANWELVDVGLNTYGGPSPASENETKGMQNLIKQYPHALMYIDYHTNGSASTIGGDEFIPNTNWHMLHQAPYISKDMEEISSQHIGIITDMIPNRYNFNAKGKMLGCATRDTRSGNSKLYAYQYGIKNGIVFEGLDKLTDETVWRTNRCQMVNTEIFINYLANAISYFERK